MNKTIIWTLAFITTLFCASALIKPSIDLNDYEEECYQYETYVYSYNYTYVSSLNLYCYSCKEPYVLVVDIEQIIKKQVGIKK